MYALMSRRLGVNRVLLAMFIAHLRQLEAAPNEQQFVRSVRWWSLLPGQCSNLICFRFQFLYTGKFPCSSNSYPHTTLY